MTIVAYTGHRPDKLGGYRPSPLQSAVREQLVKKTRSCGATAAISGMALGVDTWAAEICTELEIPWCAAIPFLGQESEWPLESQLYYRRLLAQAHMVTYVSPGGYSREKMQIRNRWMVDHCDLLIAVWDGTMGGTWNCVKYAERTIGEGRIIRIDPRDLI